MKTIYLIFWIINAFVLDFYLFNKKLAILFVFNTCIPAVLLIIRLVLLHEEVEKDPFI